MPFATGGAMFDQKVVEQGATETIAPVPAFSPRGLRKNRTHQLPDLTQNREPFAADADTLDEAYGRQDFLPDYTNRDISQEEVYGVQHESRVPVEAQAGS